MSAAVDINARNFKEDSTIPREDEKEIEIYHPEENRCAPEELEDVPPDGGYGWVCVVCVFLINFHTWGVNSTYGVFLAHYLVFNTFPGATALEYAFVGGLSISLAMLTAPLATMVIRIYGTRLALFIGIALETAGLLGASFSTQIWHLFLSQGLAFGFGMGFLFVASVGVVPQWFKKKRSFANAIATAGSGFGGLTYSLAANAIIQSINLAWAFRILAIVTCGVNVVCTLAIKDRNKAVGSIHHAFNTRLLKRPEFLLLLGWGVFSMLGYIGLLFSLPNYAKSVGMTAKQGSTIGAILNLGQGMGRPFVGLFSDRFGRINMGGTCTFLAGLFCLAIWIPAHSYGVLIFFALITGMVAGTFWVAVGPISAEVVGMQTLPSALSIIWVALVIPCTFSEPIALQLRVPSGNQYLHAQIFTGCMYVAASICTWFLRAWKIRDNQRLVDEKAVAEARNAAGAALERPTSRADTLQKVKGLWAWQKV